VPEPALSEPAQQLIGVRSGGERGHYCTTTPRLEKTRYTNQLLVNGQRNVPTRKEARGRGGGGRGRGTSGVFSTLDKKKKKKGRERN
ncbi:unnamed protein product, partial [Heterotrigona itama]